MDTYEIFVDCQLSDKIVGWLECESSQEGSAVETVLVSRPLDKAGLHGLFARLRDLNIGIISLTRVVKTTDKGESA